MKLHTHSGLQVDPFKMTAKDIRLEDIAQGLSNLCRFSGQIGQHYSVAQHSVRVAAWLTERGAPPWVALLGLLHDASEAYMVDIPTMIKKRLPRYIRAEARLQREVLKAFFPKHRQRPGRFASKWILKADKEVLEEELGAFFGPGPVIPEQHSDEARREFLKTYQHLVRHLCEPSEADIFMV